MTDQKQEIIYADDNEKIKIIINIAGATYLVNIYL